MLQGPRQQLVSNVINVTVTINNVNRFIPVNM